MSSQTIFVTKGDTDVSADIGPLLQDAGATNPGDPLTGLLFNSAGLTARYREGGTGAVTTLTLATQTVTGAHSDGGFVELDSTNMPGMYRLDLSDTIVSGGNNQATITLNGAADLSAHTVHVVLLDVDLYDGVRAGMTALPNAQADAPGGLPVSDAGGLDMDQIASDTAAILLDTGTDGVVVATGSKTGYRLSATGVDDILDEPLSGHTTVGSLGQALYRPESGTAQAGSGTTVTLRSGASATDDIFNGWLCMITGGTGAGQAEFITDYVGSSKVATVGGWQVNPASDSEYVLVPFDDIVGATAPTSSENAAAVWDKVRSSHVTEGTFGAFFQSIHEGNAQSGTASSIVLDATGSSSTDDIYNFQFVFIRAGTGAGQCRQITDYTGSSKTATVAPDWITAPSTDSEYIIYPFGADAATAAVVAAAVWDSLRANHVGAGTFGEYTPGDMIRVSGSTTAADGLEAAVSGSTPLPADMRMISQDATAANNLEAAFDGTGGVSINANLEGYSELRATGGTAGDNADDLVARILTTQMTESYSADGTAPTLAQALFELVSQMQESSVVGTTLTTKQQDGSTTSMTFTLDNGDNPHSITRAS